MSNTCSFLVKIKQIVSLAKWLIYFACHCMQSDWKYSVCVCDTVAGWSERLGSLLGGHAFSPRWSLPERTFSVNTLARASKPSQAGEWERKAGGIGVKLIDSSRTDAVWINKIIVLPFWKQTFTHPFFLSFRLP